MVTDLGPYILNLYPTFRSKLIKLLKLFSFYCNWCDLRWPSVTLGDLGWPWVTLRQCPPTPRSKLFKLFCKIRENSKKTEIWLWATLGDFGQPWMTLGDLEPLDMVTDLEPSILNLYPTSRSKLMKLFSKSPTNFKKSKKKFFSGGIYPPHWEGGRLPKFLFASM
jgi:hypothetical protein